jgi:hypothetical protein
MRPFLASACVLLLVACSKRDDAPVSSSVTTEAASIPGPLAAVRGRIPKAAEGVLAFELARIETGDDREAIVLAKPVGWSGKPDFPGNLQPAKDAGLGYWTFLEIGSHCEGFCKPKADWKTIVDAKMNDAVPPSATTHEEVLPNNGRIRWAVSEEKFGKRARVYAAWYKDGASRFQTCSVSLEDDRLIAAIDAFVEVCRTAKFE